MAGLRRVGRSVLSEPREFCADEDWPKHKELVKAMRTHGVLLRDRSTDPGCDGFVRITIGVEEHVTQGTGGVEGVRCKRLDGRSAE